jgi:hypothetical protein
MASIKMSEMIAIPMKRYPSQRRYTIPIRPVGNKEVPGTRIGLKHL